MGCSSSASTGGASNPGSASGAKGGVVLGYFSGLRGGPRGNATKFLLNYCGVTYRDQMFPVGDGQKEWKAYKAASGWNPDLPFLTDGDYKITETIAVQMYIASKWKPALIGSTP